MNGTVNEWISVNMLKHIPSRVDSLGGYLVKSCHFVGQLNSFKVYV